MDVLDRTLTSDQHERLDDIAREQPYVKVVDWHMNVLSGNAGPVLRGAAEPAVLTYLTRGGTLRRLH